MNRYNTVRVPRKSISMYLSFLWMYRMIHHQPLPFFPLITNLFKFKFLKLINTLKVHIVKSLKLFVLLKPHPVVIETSVFQIKPPLFNVNYLVTFSNYFVGLKICM